MLFSSCSAEKCVLMSAGINADINIYYIYTSTYIIFCMQDTHICIANLVTALMGNTH